MVTFKTMLDGSQQILYDGRVIGEIEKRKGEWRMNLHKSCGWLDGDSVERIGVHMRIMGMV